MTFLILEQRPILYIILEFIISKFMIYFIVCNVNMSCIFSNLRFFEKWFSVRIIRAYHYSPDCFLLKFNYYIALISPGCYTIILMGQD